MSSSPSHRSSREETGGPEDISLRNISGPTLFAFATTLHNKLSKIRTPRRTLSQPEIPSRPERFPSRDSVDSLSPPPSYQTNAETSDRSEEEATTPSLEVDMPPSRPSTSGSATPYSPALESNSGIQWNWAQPGLSFLKLAKEEAGEYSSNPDLIRFKYVSGVASAIQGLPADLTHDEERILRAALPPPLMHESESPDNQVATSPRSNVQRRDYRAMRPSVLHCGVAYVTLHLFLAITFLVPYVHYLLQQAYQFDRKYKVSDWMLAKGVVAADVMGRGTITLASQVCAMNDGKMGESLKEAGIYLVQGFSSGIYDGVGDGLQRYGLRTTEEFRSESVEGGRGQGERDRERPRSSPAF